MTYTLQQQKENRKAWVKALRSGDYKQGKGALCQKDNTSNLLFCCLGVAGDISPLEKIDKNSGFINFGFNGKPKYDSGYQYIANFMGLKTTLGQYSHTSLANLNDDGFTFDQIADIIEYEPEGLFND